MANERQEAINAIRDAIPTTDMESDAAAIVDMLIDRGWGLIPDLGEIVRVLDENDPEGGVTDPEEIDFWDKQARAIVALMKESY